MKILYLVTDFNLVGGKEQYDRNVLRMLGELGERVCVVKLTGTNPIQKAVFVMRAFIQAILFRPDVVFCAYFAFSPISLFVKKLLRISYIVFTHGMEVWNIKSGLYKRALRETKLVVTVSRYTAQKLIDQVPELRERIFFLKNSVDENRFLIKEKPQYLIDRHKLGGRKVILTVSHLYPTEERKGYLAVINALAEIKKAIPEIIYIIVGAGLKGFGDNRERIRAYAKEKAVGDFLILAGRVSDKELVDYYNLCDFFVMPSTQEGFGIVFLEALACGKPVIAGNKDGSRDAVLDGRLGILVDPENTEEIANAIIRVLKRRVQKRFYDREYLRKRVLEVYGYENFRKNVKELLKLLA